MAAEKTLSFKINIDGVSNESIELEKLSYQISNLKKEKSELLKLAKAEGILSLENKQKLAAYTKEINAQEASLKTLKRVVDTANDSLERKKALLIKLTSESNKASESVAAKMAPAIKKLNDEIKAGEEARGVFTRNVGNYPGLAGAATDGMNQLSSAVGGVTSEIGSAATSFLSAGGVVGVFTATIGALAAAWKRTQENIELYLGSADKLKFGYAGFAQDAESARKDAIRRSSGQIATGRMQLTEANRIIDFAGSSAEQKEQAKQMAEQAKAMIQEGQAFRDQVIGIKDKITWTLQYNKLIQEEDILIEEKFAKEIEWEALEANLIKQRAIVSNQESTSAQKKQAAIDAEVIANKLVKEKTDYIDRQIKNIEDVSAMTFTQEVVEDKINGLLREKNTIQKEFYSDQVKINKLESASEKTIKKDNTEAQKRIDERKKQDKIAFDEGTKFIEEEIKRMDAEKKTIWDKEVESSRRIMEQNKKTAEQIYNDREEKRIKDEKAEEEKEKRISELKKSAFAGAQMGADAIFNAKKSRLNAEMEAELSKENITEGQKAVIRKKYAKEQQRIDVNQALINTALAIGNALATSKPFFPTAIIGAAMAALQGGIQVSTIKAQKYATGGKIQGGFQVHSDTSRDNTLIYAKQGETVLNERQIAALGGSATMRRIKVPGYANGGYIGQQAPEIPATGFDYAAMARLMNSIEVNLNIHKLNSAQREVQIITETQRI